MDNTNKNETTLDQDERYKLMIKAIDHFQQELILNRALLEQLNTSKQDND